MKIRCFILLFLTAFASAVTGTYTQHTAKWKGFTRYYAVYVPRLPSGSMVLFLHGTSAFPSIPYSHVSTWEPVSDQGGFIMVWPISTLDPSGPQPTWHWECDGCSSGFPETPDDSGFLRWLITSLQSQYSISPGKTFVAGMSSGGFMTHRVGMELSDLIAAIAPVSGMQYIQPSGTKFVAPLVPNPVSVYELHGDLDGAVPYCGGVKFYWSGVRAFSPSIDSDVSFWDGPNANNCTAFSQSQPLCTVAGHPTRNVNGQDATGCLGGVEVVFERELGEGHTWPAGTEAKIWAFFQAHSR